MNSLYHDLCDAFPQLTEKGVDHSTWAHLARNIMEVDNYGTSYPVSLDTTNQELDFLDNLGTEEYQSYIRGDLPEPEQEARELERVPLPLVIHLYSLGLPDADKVMSSLDNPVVDKLWKMLKSMSHHERRLAYKLLVLEHLTKNNTKGKARVLKLDKVVDWSQATDSFTAEIKALAKVLSPGNVLHPLGKPLCGNLSVDKGKNLIPLMCQHGILVSPILSESKEATLSRAIGLLSSYNKECDTYDLEPVHTIGIYEEVGEHDRRLTTIDLSQVLPIEKVLSLTVGL